MIIDKLPAFNPEWDPEAQKKWLEVFKALMDLQPK